MLFDIDQLHCYRVREQALTRVRERQSEHFVDRNITEFPYFQLFPFILDQTS